MLRSNPPCNYLELTEDEFIQLLGAERPVLYLTCSEIKAAAGLRAWSSGLLPWQNGGQVTHVLSWSDGSLMVSKKVWDYLCAR